MKTLRIPDKDIYNHTKFINNLKNLNLVEKIYHLNDSQLTVFIFREDVDIDKLWIEYQDSLKKIINENVTEKIDDDISKLFNYGLENNIFQEPLSRNIFIQAMNILKRIEEPKQQEEIKEEIKKEYNTRYIKLINNDSRKRI